MLDTGRPEALSVSSIPPAVYQSTPDAGSLKLLIDIMSRVASSFLALRPIRESWSDGAKRKFTFKSKAVIVMRRSDDRIVQAGLDIARERARSRSARERYVARHNNTRQATNCLPIACKQRPWVSGQIVGVGSSHRSRGKANGIVEVEIHRKLLPVVIIEHGKPATKHRFALIAEKTVCKSPF